MQSLRAEDVRALIRAALAEDLGSGDVTTASTVGEEARVVARMMAREELMVAGGCVVEWVYGELDAGIAVEIRKRDGERAAEGEEILIVRGPARPILSGERVALNFMQRLCGIATLTAEYVAAVRGTKAKILDTRKTTPGWRALEKYAVVCGGGRNHRRGLYDGILIKDNHLVVLRREVAAPIVEAVRRCRERHPGLEVEVEAETLEDVRQALAAGADIVLLDNMVPEGLRQAVEFLGGRARTEASGGVSLATVGEIAKTGVDFISVGALTHSARAVDLGLDFEF